ncbi:MAG TPA: hypothetical protein VLA12_10445, partial [Planctomycetaceae bacterium]|nr:hypothetical protein [Planctomycetaceae bacterium]
KGFEWRVKQSQASIDTATSIAFGLAGDRNDAIDSIAQNCLFRLIGSSSVVVETDDGTTDNDDVATGQTLVDSYKTFKVDFSAGKSNIKFYMSDGNGAMKRVASGTTFSMAAYTASLQPIVQIQKTSDSNADGVTLDYFHAWGIR